MIMADKTFDYQGARNAGYSDSEIADFLAKSSNFKADAARKAGYSDTEIISHLSPKSDLTQKSVGTRKSEQLTADINKKAIGIGEAALHTVSGALAPVSGLAEVALGNVTGSKESADVRYRRGKEEATYDPRTKEGRETVKALGDLMSPVAKAMDLPGKYAEKGAKAVGVKKDDAAMVHDYISDIVTPLATGAVGKVAGRAAGAAAGQAGKVVGKAATEAVDRLSDKVIEAQAPNALGNIVDRFADRLEKANSSAAPQMRKAAEKIKSGSYEELLSQVNNGNSSLHRAITEMKGEWNQGPSSKANLVDTLKSFSATPGQAAAEAAKKVGSAAVEGAKSGTGYNKIRNVVDQVMPNAKESTKTMATIATQAAASAVVPHVGAIGGVLGAGKAIKGGIKAGKQAIGPAVSKAIERYSLDKIAKDAAPKGKGSTPPAPEPDVFAPDTGKPVFVRQTPKIRDQKFDEPATKTAQVLPLSMAADLAPARPKASKGLDRPISISESSDRRAPDVPIYDARMPAAKAGDPPPTMIFKKDGKGADFTDTYRRDLPQGSGATFAAESLKKVGITRPKHIKVSTITPKQPTLAELANGVPVKDTNLGKFVGRTADRLGGKVKNWSTGVDERGKPWIKGDIEY